MVYGIYKGGNVIAKFVAPTGVISNNPVRFSDTISLKRQITRMSAQRWEIASSVEPLVVGAQELFVDLVVNGHSEAIVATMPQNYGAVQNTTANSVVTSLGASAGSNVVGVTNSNGVISKGTFVRFAGLDTKVYMVTEDLNGDGNLQIFPKLRKDVANTAVMSYRDDVLLSCLYDTDTITGMSYSDGILMDVGTVKLVEKLT